MRISAFDPGVGDRGTVAGHRGNAQDTGTVARPTHVHALVGGNPAGGLHVPKHPSTLAPAPGLSVEKGTATIIQLRGVEKTYHLGKVDVRALRGIDLTIERGEMVSIRTNACLTSPVSPVTIVSVG